MFGLGMPELLVILVIIFLLFGAKRLPGIARALGRAIREFRNPSPDEENTHDSREEEEHK
ncbi:MAG: twin-arginine translocase TatA/TatE family subunit [Elusimicrobia bacterium]|nr:twin-arginine translocase TatA/TatE family subunit [Elusimicrobiota bacterium]